MFLSLFQIKRFPPLAVIVSALLPLVAFVALAEPPFSPDHEANVALWVRAILARAINPDTEVQFPKEFDEREVKAASLFVVEHFHVQVFGDNEVPAISEIVAYVSKWWKPNSKAPRPDSVMVKVRPLRWIFPREFLYARDAQGNWYSKGASGEPTPVFKRKDLPPQDLPAEERIERILKTRPTKVPAEFSIPNQTGELGLDANPAHSLSLDLTETIETANDFRRVIHFIVQTPSGRRLVQDFLGLESLTSNFVEPRDPFDAAEFFLDAEPVEFSQRIGHYNFNLNPLRIGDYTYVTYVEGSPRRRIFFRKGTPLINLAFDLFWSAVVDGRSGESTFDTNEIFSQDPNFDSPLNFTYLRRDAEAADDTEQREALRKREQFFTERRRFAVYREAHSDMRDFFLELLEIAGPERKKQIVRLVLELERGFTLRGISEAPSDEAIAAAYGVTVPVNDLLSGYYDIQCPGLVVSYETHRPSAWARDLSEALAQAAETAQKKPAKVPRKKN